MNKKKSTSVRCQNKKIQIKLFQKVGKNLFDNFIEHLQSKVQSTTSGGQHLDVQIKVQTTTHAQGQVR